MAIVDGYITNAEAQAWIGANAANPRVTTDGYLDDLITGVSRDIDEFCGRRFFRRGTVEEPVTRYYAAKPCSSVIEIDDLVTAVEVHTDDGTGSFATEVTGAALLPRNAAADGRPFTELRVPSGSYWPVDTTHGSELVRVSGVWGWPAVPEQVKTACKIQVARLYSRPSSALGLASGFGEFGAMRVFGDGWDQDAEARLLPLRRIPVLVA